jgi:predicted DCC family thiol-disulfide oxidoreductase YuxK
VIYDAGCGLCSRSVVVLSRLDVLKRLRFADVDSGWAWLSRELPALDRDTCLAEMHVITSTGRILAGYDAFRAIAWVLPFGWLTLPLLYLPGVPQVGRRAYRFIATHRTTTTCAVPVRPAS